jgi:hypothetical protein
MAPVVRRAIPVLIAALALAHTGCGSKPSERTPTGPRPPASGDEGRLSAMAVAPPLGAAGAFAVLGSSTVTNTGPSVVNGDLGVSPGAAVVGFPPGIVNGTIHAADAASLAAQNSIVTAYNALAGQPCDTDLTGQDLGGMTLIPGAYCFSTSAQLTGTLTLNGLGNPGAVWVFQIGSTLTTASNSQVLFLNSGRSCGTFWQVGSSATLGTTTGFAGNILALASVTLNTGATNSGAVFARNGAATLDSNVLSVVGSCGGVPPSTPPSIPPSTPPSTPPSPVPALPDIATLGLLAILLAGGAFVLGRR